MTRVRCLLDRCVYWLEGFCSAEEIELDPELGCLTSLDESLDDEEEWGNEELFGLDDWGEEEL